MEDNRIQKLEKFVQKLKENTTPEGIETISLQCIIDQLKKNILNK